MKRRHFMAAASVGAGAALWPSWLRDAFGDDACAKGDGKNDKQNKGESAAARIAAIAAAYRGAREAGKPLLVLVIPDGEMEKWERGRAFGELLNHGDDKQLAPLSRVEVVSATMADLKKIVPTAGAGEPMMVLVSTDKVPAVARQLDAELPAYAAFGEPGDPWEERERKEDAISAKRIAVMAGLLRGALGEADRAAKALAADVRQRLTIKPPRGARWATSYGCGTTVEGADDNVAFGCGMGHVPKQSQRFLYFFTKRVF